MLFVVDKPRLKTMLSIARDDRGVRRSAAGGPFLRLQAAGNTLRISGDFVDIEMPATVYESGVLFLRTTRFRRMINAMDTKMLGSRFLTFQINQNGMVFADVRFGLDALDMLLYPDPSKAPERHPEERFLDSPEDFIDPQGTLF